MTMRPVPAVYPGTAPTNERRVDNDSTSLRVTVPTSNNYRRQNSQEEMSYSRRNPPFERSESVNVAANRVFSSRLAVSRASDVESRDDEDEVEDESDNEEQVLNNLRSVSAKRCDRSDRIENLFSS